MDGFSLGLLGLLLSSQLPAGPSVFGATAVPAVEAPHPDDMSVDAEKDRIARMTVGVMIGNKGPYPFVVDTASDRTVISGRLAEELGLKAGDPVIVHGVAGKSRVATAIVPKLTVGTRTISDVSAPVFDERALGAVGLLGIDALADQRVTMDFRVPRLTVHAPPKREPVDPDMIVVSARRRFGQLILADAAVRGEQVYAIVDTGAQITIGNSALRDRLFRGRNLPEALQVKVIGVDGQTTQADFLVISEMRIGSMLVRNVPIAFADVPPFRMFKLDKSPAMLLGTSTLRGFQRVALDFEKKKVRFLPVKTPQFSVTFGSR